MKIGALSALGHNMADSLASGICFMAGIYSVDIFGEAARSREGEIRVDFLAGTIAGSPASDELKAVVRKFAELLPLLAQRNGFNAADILVLSVRFGTDRVLGKHFSVTVEDAGGRRSVDQYVGVPGRRYGRARRSSVLVGTVAARETG